MRDTIKKAISTSVQDLVTAGFETSFTEKELRDLGVTIPEVRIEPDTIKNIRHKAHVSQSVFARLLNVSPSSIRQWEQGKRRPTGSTKVLLEILDKEPHVLDYRMETSGGKKIKAA